jgi:DNA-binding beta-propeller fold protein YncE
MKRLANLRANKKDRGSNRSAYGQGLAHQTPIGARGNAFIATLLAAFVVTYLASSQAATVPVADVPLRCNDPQALKALVAGYKLQAQSESEKALSSYEACLKTEPTCVSCLYESGWSFWRLGRWSEVIRTWEAALALEPKHEKILQFLPAAKQNQLIIAGGSHVETFRSKTKIFTESEPKDAPISMTLVGRQQSYDSNPQNPLDHFDSSIYSPKSVNFSPDGKTVYVNALEGGKTVIYDAKSLQKTGVISHTFTAEDRKLFTGEITAFGYHFPKSVKEPLVFTGKPVEAVLSHNGRFLWTPYYRRSFDEYSNMPSALALIDTAQRKVIRVFPTGPIAKYVQVSPDGHWLAVSNWGDNTIGLYDIRGNDPAKFKPAHLLTVETKLALVDRKANRDKACGFCVRGLAFTSDSQHLIVGRMAKGGFAIFNLRNFKKPVYLGTVKGLSPGPRDVHIDLNGEYLYSSCNASGSIIKVKVKRLLEALAGKQGQTVNVAPTELGVQSVFAGLSVRTIKFSPDDNALFAAVNQSSEVLAIDTSEMKIVSRIPVDSYPVGLAVSPDGLDIWVTSQGRDARGGNSVGIYTVRYKTKEHIAPAAQVPTSQSEKN